MLFACSMVISNVNRALRAALFFQFTEHILKRVQYEQEERKMMIQC